MNYQIWFIILGIVLFGIIAFVHFRSVRRFYAYKFQDAEGLIKPVWHLHVLGFLVPGTGALALVANSVGGQYSNDLEDLVQSLGIFLVLLGLIHFLNILLAVRFTK